MFPLAAQFRNILRLTTGDFLAKTLNFLATLYLARVLGVTHFGVIEFALAVLAYFLVIADSGLEMLSTREVARNPQVPMVRALASRMVPLRLLLAVCTLGVLLLLLPLFPAGGPRLIIGLFGLTLLPQALSLKWVFLGLERMAWVARVLVLTQAVFIVTVVAFVRSPEQIWYVPLFRFLGELAAAVYAAVLFHRHSGGIRLPLSLAGAGQEWRPAVQFGAYQAMGLLHFSFDSVLLGFLRGTASVGLYAAAYKPITVALALPLTFFTGLFPSLSRTYTDDKEKFRELAARALQLCLILAVPLVIGATALAGPIIQLLFGPDYSGSAVLLQILIWSAALVILRKTYSTALLAAGHQQLELRSSVTSAVCNVALNLLLIPTFGMVGAAAATVTADLLWATMAYVYFRRFVWKESLRIAWQGPVVAGAVMAAWFYFEMSWHWVLRGVVGTGLYFAILLVYPGSLISWGQAKK